MSVYACTQAKGATYAHSPSIFQHHVPFVKNIQLFFKACPLAAAQTCALMASVPRRSASCSPTQPGHGTCGGRGPGARQVRRASSRR